MNLETIAAAQFLIENTDLHTQTLKVWTQRKAKPEFILMTEGALGEPQIIRIPENTFEYPLHLMLNFPMRWFMWHKMPENTIHDKTRENGEVYYKSFHEISPSLWTLRFHKLF
jgi:hypothetical protein